MISLTQIAYGSRVARQGSSRRTCAKCATTAVAIARSWLTRQLYRWIITVTVGSKINPKSVVDFLSSVVGPVCIVVDV